MSNTLNLFNFNARGLGDRKKRMAVFLWLKSKGSGVYLLQECHSTANSEQIWQQDWDGRIEFSHGNSNCRGVAILITKNVPIDISSVFRDNDGRFLLLQCNYGTYPLTIVNLYAPTSDKRSQQIDFGCFLNDQMSNFVGDNIILGGDLNICLYNLKNSNSTGIPSYGDSLSQMCETLDLMDIWRLKNANITRFTRREQTSFGFSQSRIDYFLILSHLQYHLCKTDIVPNIKSDHSLLLLIFDIEVENKRGRGLWKLNTGLHLDNEYINVIKDTINIAKLDAQNLQNKNLVWDFIKCRIQNRVCHLCYT